MGLPPSKLEWGKLFPYAKLAGSSRPRTILRYCFNLGVFCYFGNSWFALCWPVDMALPHISVLELIPIVWLPVIGENSGQASESFSSDHTSAAMQALQKYTSRNPHLLKLLRHMAYFAIKFNFNFSAVHVEGKLNQKAEALPRFRFQVFRELCPSVDAAATDIDPTLFKDPICPP